MKHEAKKRFGQNFLTDILVKDRIIQNCNLQPDDIILEIGPGKGAITELIAPKVKQIIAVEADKDLIQILEDKFADTNVTIIHQDFLTFDIDTLPDNIKIISNLPYNIASPIIEKVIAKKEKFSEFYMTVQLEFGQRLCAQANSKSYGSLSCFVQYHTDVKLLFRIGAKSFTPQPKVQSCFLRMQFRHTPEPAAHDETLLFRIIKAAFLQRRKTIVNSIGAVFDKKKLLDILNDLKIDPKKRAENLSVAEYIQIADRLS